MPDSEAIRRLVEQADVIATSVVAYPEARATFARRRRERLMTPVESNAAVKQLDADWRRLVTILLGEDLAQYAGRIADAHGVRGFDAVHLASFETLLGHADDEVSFSSADARLGKAARTLG